MGLPLIRGRLVSADDREGTLDVAVINQAAAKRHFAGVDPVGRRIQASRGDSEPRWLTIVGMVGDNLEFYDVDETVYVPYAQHAATAHASQAVFVVRCSDTTETTMTSIRNAIRSIDPQLAVFDAATADALYASALAGAESASLLAGLLAVIGVIVAVVGVYASMAFSITQRQREVAIRMALGGVPGSVLATLVTGAVRTLALGIGFGIVGALILSRLLASVLPGIDPAQVLLLAAVSVALAASALVAAYLPARRAVQSDPAAVLRQA